MNDKINYQAAFNSDAFKKAKYNRLKFALPLLAFFTILFFCLFAIQSFLTDIGELKIIGQIDLSFLFVMLLFPVTGILGIWFTRYTKTHVYPYEDQVVRTYSKKG